MMRKINKVTEYTCKCGTTFVLKRKTKGIPRCQECLYQDVLIRQRKSKYYTLEKYKEMNHSWRLKKYYGITKEKYNQISEQQGNVCAICKQIDPKTKLVVDHDHSNREIRGLLCHRCNRVLGVLCDDLKLFRSCMSYLMKSEKRRSWDEYFLDIADLVATRSKDPSTKVGAVIVRDKIILSTGYNGFARGVNDNIPERYDRPEKYLWTIHAEENAILNAGRIGIKTDGASLYVTPMHPCSNCALSIVQSGIKEVIFNKSVENPRFEKSFEKATEIFNACNILVRTPDRPTISEKLLTSSHN